MAPYKDFDINTSTTPKPWGAREEQMVKDLIDTLVLDTIGGVKRITGHLHSLLYNADEPANYAVKIYNDLGRRTIDIGRQKYGHNVAINCPEDGGVFSVNNCNAYLNTPGIQMVTDAANGCSTSIGNHYFGYPLKADFDGSVSTRNWYTNFESDGISSWGDISVQGCTAYASYSKIASMEIGNIVFMHLAVFGTSNAQYFRMELPYNIRMAQQDFTGVIGILSGLDNGVFIGPVEAAWENSANRVVFGTPGAQDTFWTNSGQKGIQGMLIFTMDDPIH